METREQRHRLPIRMKAGYAIGALTDSCGFNVFYFFFLFFLTDYAGVPAGIAGTISLIAVCWDAITDPIIGHFSDNRKNPNGRRRPLMLFSLIPYCLAVFFIFNNFEFSLTGQIIYFTACALIFWTGYTLFVIPYFALGAEMTQDFDERTSLRIWFSVVMGFAVMMASATPPLIVDNTIAYGGTGVDGWRNVGIIFALIIAAAILVCWRLTKGGEPTGEAAIKNAEAQSTGVGGFFRNYGSIFLLKPFRIIIGSAMLWAIVCSMASGGLVYLMANNLGYSPQQQSLAFVVLSLISIAWLPFYNWGATKWDKRSIYFPALLIGAIGMVAFYFIGFPSFIVLCIYLLVFQFGNSGYWALSASLMYDINEFDEFLNGKRREGSIASLMSFTQKLGAGIALWLNGQILDHFGYNGALQQQGESALSAIMAINTWLPGILGLAAAVFAFMFPITRASYTALMEALKAKKEGREYSVKGFRKLF